ncbi:hypothetical protein SELSPUOL_00570 [Selenomonas sputigena ATCC 35185]|uniref:Uncharacterized protein n=1 Tax=Selenomonas sputigena (strain ATCC 35185 / DSM 20758 / CCUG 44933 / VPI D19B-28) TaxID=546271 RepID=C9LSZ0_SELS3|nr:hypothetical protein SELSPUOL_00570 [Selenomonas sputigena ATCC 35185]
MYFKFFENSSIIEMRKRYTSLQDAAFSSIKNEVSVCHSQ